MSHDSDLQSEETSDVAPPRAEEPLSLTPSDFIEDGVEEVAQPPAPPDAGLSNVPSAEVPEAFPDEGDWEVAASDPAWVNADASTQVDKETIPASAPLEPPVGGSQLNLSAAIVPENPIDSIPTLTEAGDKSIVDVAPSSAPPIPAAHVSSEETSNSDHSGEADIRFFLREAEDLADSRPEQSGLMRVSAAECLDLDGAPLQETLAHLSTAKNLNPNSPWLIALVRRQLMRLGSYDQAIELTDQEVALGGDGTARVGALRETAALLKTRHSDPGGALRLLRQALVLQPGHVGALANTIGLQLEQGLYGEAAETVAHLAQVLSNPQERALYLYMAGTLREMYLDQPEAAEAAYCAALEADPEHLPAAIALCDHYERTEQWEPACRSLAHLAQLQPDSESKARLLLRAGTLYLDRTDNLEAAARELTAAATAAPRDPTPLQRLAYVYEAKGNCDALVATLRQLVELTLDTQGQAALLTRIGWLLQGDPQKVEDAIGAYQEALKMVPGYLPAVQALGTLHRRRHDYERLLLNFKAEAEGPLPADLRAVRLVEIAELLGGRLSRADEAAQAYRRALELQPGMHAAFWGLRRILKRQGLFEQLGQLLVDQIETSADEQTQNAFRLELADLQANQLSQPNEAIRTLDHVKGQARSAALALMDLYEREQRFGELVELLLAEADRTTDQSESRGWRLRAAHLLEFELHEQERALAVHNEIIAKEPDSVQAIRAAGRLQHRLGRWRELIQLHRHELEHDPQRADVVATLCRMGRIYDQHLGDAPAAIDAYLKAIQHDPTCGPALAALERLTRTEQRWADLVTVLTQYAEARTEPAAAADALCRAAELADTRLGDIELATQLYQQAIERCPDFSNAYFSLVRVNMRRRKWTEVESLLSTLIDRCDSLAERGHLQIELARVKEFYLKQPPPVQLYEAAIEASPFGDRLRAELVRANRMLRADLKEPLERLGASTTEPALASAYLLEGVHLAEFAKTSSSGRADMVHRAWETYPEDSAACWALERHLYRDRDWSLLGGLLEKEAERTLDAASRLREAVSAAKAHLLGNNLERATELANHCLEVEEDHTPALRLLAAIFERQEQWPRVAEVLDRIAAACENRDNRREMAFFAAKLWAERVDDTEHALTSLKTALREDPAEHTAFALAEQLLTSEQRFEDLARIYGERIKATRQLSERIDLLREQARLLRHHVGDASAAIAALRELLLLAPKDVEAMAELAEILCGEQRWSDAAEILMSLIARSDHNQTRRLARLRLAEIWLGHLHNPGQARLLLETALDDDPTDAQAKRYLVDVTVATGEWQTARQLLEELAADEDPMTQVWALDKLATVAHLGLRDQELRSQCELEALGLAISLPSVFPQLVTAYRDRNEQDRLIKLGQEVLASEQDPKRTHSLRLALGRILLEDRSEPDLALEYLQPALRARPEDEERACSTPCA